MIRRRQLSHMVTHECERCHFKERCEREQGLPVGWYRVNGYVMCGSCRFTKPLEIVWPDVVRESAVNDIT